MAENFSDIKLLNVLCLYQCLFVKIKNEIEMIFLFLIGYTSSRIASFEQRAQEKQTGPTRHLFADWAKREDSTVANLLQSLCNIGRHDVTLVLLPIAEKAAVTLPRTRQQYKPISVV